MRVIAGWLGGRLFASPNGHRTHPMSDKIRGAMFNILGDIEGMTVLDAFAGSGALSFEAASRGASTIIAIERDRNAQSTITDNIRDLKLENHVQLVKAGARSWLNTTDTDFDLVLLDPPYDALQYDLLEDLAYRTKPDGRIVLSWPGNNTDLPKFDHHELISSKNYGDSSLYVYRRS